MARRVRFVAGVLVLCACSTGTVASPSGPATSPAPPESEVDGGSVNGCDVYEDLTADTADRTIVWVRTVGRKCLQIRRGQAVRWDPRETFDRHPLHPLNGSSENPIVEQRTGSQIYAPVFDSLGTFGFACAFHFDMTGAIRVIE